LSLRFKCHLISSSEALPLRARILRPGQAQSAASFPDDESSSTFHIGVFNEQKLVCVATLVVEKHPYFTSYKNSFRLRGMATDTEFQGQGAGRLAILFSLQELRQRDCDFLWCNARQLAFSFYERLGFNFYGGLFDIPGVGPHKVMYKEL
jgi:ribosomal protein S18 acetylase RimI-like enzyme